MDKIVDMYKKNREFALLQWTYLGVTVVTFVVAGLLALINQPLGTAILVVPAITGIIFLANIVAWALVKLIIESLKPEVKKTDKK